MLTLNRFAYDSALKRRKKLLTNVNYQIELSGLTENIEDNIVDANYILYGF